MGRGWRLRHPDRVRKQLAVRHEHALGLRLELGIAQIDLHHAAGEPADVDAIAYFEWPIEQDKHAGEDVGDAVLQRKAEGETGKAEAGDDTHSARYRGNRARLELRQGAQQNYRPQLYVVPEADIASALERRIAALQAELPGIGLDRRDGEWRVFRRVLAYDWVDEQVAATEPEAVRFGPRLPLGGRFPDDPIYDLLRAR